LKAYEYTLLTALHTGRWDLAAELWGASLATPAFTRFAGSDFGVRWRLYEIYLRFLLQDHLAPRPTLFKPRFASTKVVADFLETTSVLPKEESETLHISLYVAHLLMLSIEHNTDEMCAVVTKLEQFQDKYLRKDAPNYRLQCFLRLIQAAREANFDFDETLRKTRKYVEWLGTARAFDTVSLRTLEVLPYDHAWTLLLRTMKFKNEAKHLSQTEMQRLVQNPYHFYGS
jgi:hypothetical protein